MGPGNERSQLFTWGQVGASVTAFWAFLMVTLPREKASSHLLPHRGVKKARTFIRSEGKQGRGRVEEGLQGTGRVGLGSVALSS